MTNKGQTAPIFPAEAFKKRLRQDLMAAMRGRQERLAATLRTLIAAIDNREAPALSEVPADARVTGPTERASEIGRLRLSRLDIVRILRVEVSEREQAAATMERFGRSSQANRLRAESAVVARYLEELETASCDIGDTAAAIDR